MQHQEQIDDLRFCPSFNCYSSDTPSSTAATRVTSQLLTAPFHDDDDFEFSVVLRHEEISAVDEGRKAFPLFNRDLLIHDEVLDRDAEVDEQLIAGSASLEELFINEREKSASSSSSEADESEGEGEQPGVFCAWRPRMDVGSSPLSKCKKSSSTGSGSKRWRIRDLLRRSNSEGNEPMLLLTHKNVEQEIRKQKVINPGEVSLVAVKSKPSVHELFYVQQRAKREDGKRKSYLPYRQGLVGFFTNVNGKGKKFTFK